MKWKKHGQIFFASGQLDWMRSHTQVPTVLDFEDRIRVYFSTRGTDGVSRPAFVDLDRNDPTKVIYIHDKPILELGEPGTFDEHGIIPNYVFRHEGRLYLFYVGWSRRESIPYANWTGIAVSDDNGRSFTRMFRGPILDRTPDELYSATGLICFERDGEWLGWYATGTQWLKLNDRWEHTYEIRSCRSYDFISWTRPNQRILPTTLPNESNTRPTIINLNDKWHMWFCYRGTQDFRNGADSYRIGYASSHDLETWTRNDLLAGITTSEEGWDSKMIAYPWVTAIGDRVLMFYSGNGFGQEGFGFAELEAANEL